MERVLFTDYVLLDKDIFFFDGRSRLPGIINVDSGIVTYINDIIGYEIEKDSVSYSLLKNEKIYVLLNGGYSILVYDIKKKICEYIGISCGKAAWGNFVGFYENKNELFVFPKYKSEVLCLNADSNELDVIPIAEIMPSCGCKVEETIWLFSKDGRQALVFDIRSKKDRQYKLKEPIENLVSCECVGDAIYLLNRYGGLYMLDVKTGVMKKLIVAKDEGDNKSTVARLLVVAEKIIIFPSMANEIKIVDLKTNEVEIYSEYPDDLIYYKDVLWSKYFGITEDEEFYYLLRKSNYMLKIKKNTGTFEWIKIIMPSIVDKEIALFNYGKIEYKEREYGNESFIGLIKDIYFEEQEIHIRRGYNIWNYIK